VCEYRRLSNPFPSIGCTGAAPSSDWPPGGLALAKGQKLRITCSWHNTDGHEVRFGPLTTDEMCFIIGFFYRPDESVPVAPGEGCLPSRTGLLCPFARAVPSP
jgi:hypothetical protein